MVEPMPAEHIVVAGPVKASAPAGAFAVPWPDIVLLVVGFRVLLTLVGGATYVLLPQAQQPSGVAALVLNPWRYFDALRFTQIAAHGYTADGLNTAYMPIFPLLTRVVGLPLFAHY